MAAPAYSLLITLLVISTLLCSAMAQPSPAPPPQMAAGCVDELVLFSPCLSFVSAPPNNLSETVPSKCCDAFSSSIDSGNGFCLCYLISQPRILGFRLNESRVLSLPSVCSPGNNESTRIGYFEALCHGSEGLNPLLNGTVSGVSNSSNSGSNNQSSTMTSLPPQSNNPIAPSSLPSDSKNKNPSTKSSPPPERAKGPQTPPTTSSELPRSAVAEKFYSTNPWFQKGLLVFLLVISTCL